MFVLGALGIWAGVHRGVTTWREWHHYYLALALLILALVLHHAWIAAIAGYLSLDDGMEHFTAAIADDSTKGWSPISAYVMPTLFTIPGVPALCRLLDKLCGKRPAIPVTPIARPPLPPMPPQAS